MYVHILSDFSSTSQAAPTPLGFYLLRDDEDQFVEQGKDYELK